LTLNFIEKQPHPQFFLTILKIVDSVLSIFQPKTSSICEQLHLFSGARIKKEIIPPGSEVDRQTAAQSGMQTSTDDRILYFSNYVPVAQLFFIVPLTPIAICVLLLCVLSTAAGEFLHSVQSFRNFNVKEPREVNK